MISRRGLAQGLGASAASACLARASHAQDKRRRIAILSWFAAHRRDVLVEYLQKLGYRVGETIEIEVGIAANDIARADALAQAFVARKVDLIFADATPAVLAAKRATRDIPIVMSGADPIRAGVVDSLARPGGNITGFTSASTDLAPKRVELARDIIPDLRRIGFLGSARDPNGAVFADATARAAAALGIEATIRLVPGQDGFEAAVAAIAGSGARALIAQPLFLDYARDVVTIAGRHGLPVIGDQTEFAKAGALLSFGAERLRPMQIAAEYIDRIFKGAKPGDLPIQQVTSLALVVNQLVARSFGLTVPTSVLLQADEVIE